MSEGENSNNNKGNFLHVYGHSIRPMTVSQGAVLQWKCVQCGVQGEDVTDYADVSCRESAILD